MVSMSQALPTSNDSALPARVAHRNAGAWAKLVNAIGQSAADHYVGVLHEYRLTVQLISRIHKEFAASIPADDACSGDEQIKQEIALLMELIPLLGRAQDSWLANKYGLTSTTVRSLRLRLGIMILDYSGQVPTEELGTRPDDELSEMYGVPTRFIFATRQQLKIAKNVFKCNHNEELADEQSELMKRFATTFDTERANEHGVSPERVALLRQHLGISKYIPIAKLACDRPDVITLLGTSYDSRIASEFGVPAEQVYHLRTILGIRKFSPLAELVKDMPEVVEQLGKKTDRALALAYGVSSTTIFNARQALGVPRFGTQSLVSTLPDEAIPFLGTQPDRDIASKFNVSGSVVFRARKVRGISRYIVLHDFPPEAIPLLGTAADAVLARQFGLPPHAIKRVREQRGIKPSGAASGRMAPGRVSSLPKEAVPHLGKQPDLEIASMFQVTSNVVMRARKVRGIARYTSQTDFPIDAVPLLGQTQDTAIARQFGLPTYTVKEARKQRGIAIYKPEKPKS